MGDSLHPNVRPDDDAELFLEAKALAADGFHLRVAVGCGVRMSICQSTKPR